MKNSRLIVLVAMVCMLAACGKSKKTDFFGADPEPVKPKVETITKIEKNWQIGLGKKIETGDAILSPVLFGSDIYAASANGRIYKVSAETGKQDWQVKLSKEVISAGVGVGGGLVLVGTDQGIVYALNQEDGSIAWQARLSSEILASPVIDSGIVVARTGDGKVFGLSSYDGSVKWTISRQLPKLTLRGDSRPVLTQGVAFIGFSDGNMAALQAENGTALWDFPISFPRGTNEIDRLSDVDTNPLLVGEFLYISSYQEVTHALDIRNQRIAWTSGVSSFHSLAYDAAYLYVTDKLGVVHQLDRTNGEKSWSQTDLQHFQVSAPISIGPYILVSEGDGGLYVLRKTDGAIVGKHKLGAKTIIGEPVVDSDIVYFLDSGGSLQSISIVNKS
ncbi:MAG: outer membrane protein assembly factor BamB [Arenicella sp.]|jgi:outer membrane protein assembly factor BamB